MSVLADIPEPFDSNDAFLADAQRYRRELLAHCYRMTGSLHDAEDLVQETYLRAWKCYDGFQGRSSVRTWLYRIATNTCLTSIDSRKRRPLPTGLGAPASNPTGDIAEHHEITWLEPLPDAPQGGPVGSVGDRRVAGVGAVGVRRGAAASVAASAGGAGPAGGAAVEGRGGR